MNHTIERPCTPTPTQSPVASPTTSPRDNEISTLSHSFNEIGISFNETPERETEKPLTNRIANVIDQETLYIEKRIDNIKALEDSYPKVTKAIELLTNGIKEEWDSIVLSNFIIQCLLPLCEKGFLEIKSLLPYKQYISSDYLALYGQSMQAQDYTTQIQQTIASILENNNPEQFGVSLLGSEESLMEFCKQNIVSRHSTDFLRFLNSNYPNNTLLKELIRLAMSQALYYIEKCSSPDRTALMLLEKAAEGKEEGTIVDSINKTISSILKQANPLSDEQADAIKNLQNLNKLILDKNTKVIQEKLTEKAQQIAFDLNIRCELLAQILDIYTRDIPLYTNNPTLAQKRIDAELCAVVSFLYRLSEQMNTHVNCYQDYFHANSYTGSIVNSLSVLMEHAHRWTLNYCDKVDGNSENNLSSLEIYNYAKKQLEYYRDAFRFGWSPVEHKTEDIAKQIESFISKTTFQQ